MGKEGWGGGGSECSNGYLRSNENQTMEKQHTHDRTDYSKRSLNQADVGNDPMVLFASWYKDIQEGGGAEPSAMTLSTAGSVTISSRVVLLRSFDAHGFVFYSNYNSRKAMDMERSPNVALNFFWPDVERQVRIEGKVEQLEGSLSDAYFASRPRESQIAAWASDQSRAAEDRKSMDDRYDRWKERFAGNEVPRPLHWGGYLVRPQRIEFWQGRPNRLHDRIAFEHFADGSWVKVRLQP